MGEHNETHAEEQLAQAKKRFATALSSVEEYITSLETTPAPVAQNIEDANTEALKEAKTEIDSLTQENANLNSMLDKIKGEYANLKMSSKEVSQQLDTTINELKSMLNQKISQEADSNVSS